MTNEEKTKIAIEYLTELRDSRQKVLPNEAPYYEAEKDMDMFNIAIKAIDLLIRLEGFKYVTTDVMLKEHELAHFDVYKTGWNDAIEAVKVASDRPLSEIINSIKETEARNGYEEGSRE